MPRSKPAPVPDSPAADAAAAAGLGTEAPVTDTRTRLLQAAAAEFIDHGYAHTDTNRIARRAGFAPQTFYRWYRDKVHVFVEVHRAWEEAEWAMLEALFTQHAEGTQIAEACVEGHRSFLLFRRHLRQLAVEHPLVRAARAETRRRQLAELRRWNPALDDEEAAALLVQFERLCDALAEGEFADLGLSGSGAMRALARVIEELRPRPEAQRGASTPGSS
ncbi:MAG: TetR/AcrR family transcriptional regulator [Aquabacterium sp.]|jgi:AcrR family transcriptional regulator|nr:MAG: TetR/AcrR family transcriptional regulator [Aquabacterium sp.]